MDAQGLGSSRRGGIQMSNYIAATFGVAIGLFGPVVLSADRLSWSAAACVVTCLVVLFLAQLKLNEAQLLLRNAERALMVMEGVKKMVAASEANADEAVRQMKEIQEKIESNPWKDALRRKPE